MKKIWILNHYAQPAEYSTSLRHYKFAENLIAQGYDVTVFSASTVHNSHINIIEGNDKYKYEKYGEVPFFHIKTSSYSGNGFQRIKNMIQYTLKMITITKTISLDNPDVVYASSVHPLTWLAGYVLAKRYKAKLIVETRDLWPETIVEYGGISKKNPIIWLMYKFEKFMYTKADDVIFTMEGGKDYIIDKKWDDKISLDKVHHINNGIDLEKFENDKKNFIIEDKDLMQEDIFKVIYIGSIRKINNLKQVVDCAKLLENNDSIKFFIYGDGEDKEPLEEYCKTNKIKNVLFKGRIDKKYVPYILSKASVNILNYKQGDIWKYGGSQNKLFEYLASGRPVCTNINMGYCILKKYNCGISKLVNSSEEYAELIMEFYNLKEEQYKQMCDNALKASLEYDFKNLTKKLQQLL